MSAAGLALIAQAGSFAGIIADNYSSETIAFVVGLISIFNGVGRIFFGAVYDQMGRKKTMLLIAIIFLVTAATLILAQLKGSFIFMIIAFIAAGFSYGGITPTNSAFVYSEYGQLHYSENLAFINLNLLFASFGGTISGYLYDYYGSFLSTFFAMLLAGTLSMFIVFLMDRTAKER
ncbi:MFS transporter [Tepidanaerobacter acetatoxydans]|uniref:MFS transporter n=1 Tax=Tepidanaerobacter acetatoxydans TaxID=499229 RepID=UPI00235B5DA4|nr:MFS transporter [Tepidanaerobacter acetatoxydans]